ncbi:MAG: hypothetical protein U1C74_06125 [Phenylobacterium sp.]|nr:hypothetical protein [Phenylobacterium sp.]
MLILSMTLILGLSTPGQARNAADVVWELRRVNVLMSRLITTAPQGYATSAGATAGFAWAVETLGTGTERPVEVCRGAVALQDTRSVRDYAAATLAPCPLETTLEAALGAAVDLGA